MRKRQGRASNGRRGAGKSMHGGGQSVLPGTAYREDRARQAASRANRQGFRTSTRSLSRQSTGAGPTLSL